MRNMDTSGDGAIDFGEFLEFMAHIKEKKASDNFGGFLRGVGLGSLAPPPPPPGKLQPAYFKVARLEGGFAPLYTKRWCEMEANGFMIIGETRGDVMRIIDKNGAASTKVRHKLQAAKHYEKHGEVVVDFSYVDEVRPSATGNAAGTKFEVLTLTEVGLFLAANRPSRPSAVA